MVFVTVMDAKSESSDEKINLREESFNRANYQDARCHSFFTTFKNKHLTKPKLPKGGFYKTLDESRPTVLRILDILGMQHTRNDTTGLYVVSTWRMVTVMLSVSAFLLYGIYIGSFLQSLEFSMSLMVSIYLLACLYCISAAFFALVKRRSCCRLMTTLSALNLWHRPKLSGISFVFFFYSVGQIMNNGFIDGHMHYVNITWETIVSAFCNPIIPALLDLQFIWLIRVLRYTHEYATSLIARLIKARTGEMDDLMLDLNVDDMAWIGSCHSLDPKLSGRVNVDQTSLTPTSDDLRKICLEATRAVDLFNEIFSWQILLRCLFVLSKMIVLGYFFTKDVKILPILILYTTDEFARFVWLCAEADHLRDQQRKMSDALWTVRSLSENHAEDKILFSLATRIGAHPARITLGGFASLGKHLVGSYLNITLTYGVILYQSNPISNENILVYVNTDRN